MKERREKKLSAWEERRVRGGKEESARARERERGEGVGRRREGGEWDGGDEGRHARQKDERHSSSSCGRVQWLRFKNMVRSRTSALALYMLLERGARSVYALKDSSIERNILLRNSAA
jgi:hypothetical protein